LQGIIKIGLVIFCLTILLGCRSNKVGGTIPVYMDKYVSTTEERRIEIEDELKGYIIKYQKAYDCNNKDYKYNATAIVSVDSELVTIYDYCQQYSFKAGDKVKIKRAEIQNSQWSIREIIEPFPKSSNNYGYWQCISCKYKNAFGNIELIKLN